MSNCIDLENQIGNHNIMNRNGFSIIELVIASSIMAFLSLAMSSLFIQQKNSISELEDQLEKVELVRNLETILKNGLACQLTLAGVVIPSSGNSNIANLRDGSGAVIYSSNTIANNLQIGQMSVTNDTVPGPSSSGFVDVTMPVSRVKNGVSFKPIQLKINVTVNAARAVTSCSASTSLAGYFSCNCTSWYWRGSIISPADMTGQLCYRPNGCAGGCHTPTSTWACTAL